MPLPYNSLSLAELLQLAEEDPSSLAAAIAKRVLSLDEAIEFQLSELKSNIDIDSILKETMQILTKRPRHGGNVLTRNALRHRVKRFMETLDEKINDAFDKECLTIDDIIEGE